MYKVLITGTSSGIGIATALLFLERDYDVVGLDIQEMPNDRRLQQYRDQNKYQHIIADISDPETLPEIKDVKILINNAGVQDSGRDIDINLKGTINVTEKYGVHNYCIRSILIVASTSAHNGVEFPEYCASKGGLLPYAKNVAKRVAAYGAICNTISPGGVLTEINRPIVEDSKTWQKVMNDTPLKRWATPEEIAEWIFFLTVTNKSMTGQDVIVDLGESINQVFYQPEYHT